MIRGFSILLAIGFAVLWIIGLATHATAWLTWLDLLAAVLAFAIGVMRGDVRQTSGSLIALSIGAFVLWIIGLVARAEVWLVWCTFAGACGLLIDGIAAAVMRREVPVRSPRVV